MARLRFLIGLFLLACVPTSLYAQDVYYSPYQDFDFRTGGYAVIGKIDNKLYVYRSTPEGFFLDAYNDNMELKATVILDFFPEKINKRKFILYPDKMIVFYEWEDGNKLVQSAAVLDGTGRLLKGPLKIGSEKTGVFNSKRDYFSYAVSDDKKNIVVYGVDQKKKEIGVKCIWVDDELQVKHRSAASYKAENELEYGEAIVNNDGRLFLPAYTPIGSKGLNDQLWILTLAPGERTFIPFELPMDKKYAGSTHSKIDNVNNRIYIGGFYSDKKNGNYDGVQYTWFDINTGEFKNYKATPFDEKMRNIAGESNTKRAFNNYRVNDMIVKSDGGVVMMSEDVYVTNRNSYAPGFGFYSWYYPVMSSYVREYHYDDVLVMSLSAEGNLEWSTFIRKDQYSQEDGGMFSSYAFVNTGGGLGFLFNDFNSRRSRIQMASVDNAGEIKMRSLDAGRSDDPDWLPRSSKQVGGREIIVPCLRKRQICFAKVIF